MAIAGCASQPAGERTQLFRMPLASTHADLSFSFSTGPRRLGSCGASDSCAQQPELNPGQDFVLQVERIARALEASARIVYPDLAQNAAALPRNGFDIYVVDSDQPGSASSANGRIALNSALGTWQPYDEWLAFVIGREMGHVIARHHEENSTAGITTSLLMNILLPGSGLLKNLLSASGSRIASGSKQDVQEKEADVIAVNLLQTAGFRLHDVSLSLRAASTSLNNNAWSLRFKKSSAWLVTEHSASQSAQIEPVEPVEPIKQLAAPIEE
jgi:Zn-dependent protease with chaperone function